MTDHRKLQLTLFRMYADAGFARALLAGEAAALGSTGLDQHDLGLLMQLDARQLEADPGGRRRSQLLGNSASEFSLSLAAASLRSDLSDLLDAFSSSQEFHGALIHGGLLPLAFGNYALVRAQDAQALEVEALLTLELAMAELRRSAGTSTPAPHPAWGDSSVDRTRPGMVPDISQKAEPLKAGYVRLSKLVKLVRLPLGAFHWANVLQAALDSQSALSACGAGFGLDGQSEVVLLKRAAGQHAFQLATVSPERLTPPADAILLMAQTPLSPAARAEFAQVQGATPSSLEAFLDEFLAEGVLERGDLPAE